jgi:hypothetical protein
MMAASVVRPRWRPARRSAAAICGLVSRAALAGVEAMASTARASGELIAPGRSAKVCRNPGKYSQQRPQLV